MRAANYGNLARVEMRLAQSDLQKNDVAGAKPLLRQMTGLPVLQARRAAEAPAFATSGERLSLRSADVLYYGGEAAAVLGKYAGAQKLLSSLTGSKAYGPKAALWLGLMRERAGAPGGGALVRKAVKADSALSGEIGTIRGLLGKAA